MGNERASVGGRAGWALSWGFGREGLEGLGQPSFEAFPPQGEGPGACLEPPPRLLGLYLISGAGTPAACVERPGFRDDPGSVSALLGVVADLVRDAFSPRGALVDGGILRAACGTRGFCALRSRSFGLVAAIEGRETESFLAELRRLAGLLESSMGQQLRSWDGNPDAVKTAEAGLRRFLNCAEYGGAERLADGDRVGPGKGIGPNPTPGGPEVGRPFAGSLSGRRGADPDWQGLEGRVAPAESGPFFSDPDAPEVDFLLSCGASGGSVEARAHLQGWTVPSPTTGGVDSRKGGARGPRRGEARPPRVLALYLVAATGMPAARVEREGLLEDPDAVGMMTSVVVDYVRDALSTRGASFQGGVLRAACGARGLCALPSRSFGLVAAIEGRETETFLADLGRLAASLEESVGETLQSWDGNLDAMRAAEAGLRNFLFSGKYEGPELRRRDDGPEPFGSSVAWVADKVAPVWAPAAEGGAFCYSRSISEEEVGLGHGLWSLPSSASPSLFSPPAAPAGSAGPPHLALPLAGSLSWSRQVDALSWDDQPDVGPGVACNGPDPEPTPGIQSYSSALRNASGGSLFKSARAPGAASYRGLLRAGRPRPSATNSRARAWGSARATRGRTDCRPHGGPEPSFANARER